MDNIKHFKKPKIKVFNTKGQIVRKCPKCRSTRLKRTIDDGFECLRCGFLNKRRYGSKEEIGRVTYKTY